MLDYSSSPSASDFLTHHYWRDQAFTMQTKGGREKMIKELIADVDTFEKLASRRLPPDTWCRVNRVQSFSPHRPRSLSAQPAARLEVGARLTLHPRRRLSGLYGHSRAHLDRAGFESME
jgi:hypothetical protein